MSNELYRFGAFELDPAKRRLLRAGEPVTLFPKAFDALVVLVSERGNRLSRAELTSRIWPGTSVSENNLNQVITALRRALDDDPRQPEYIATLPGHGYSFIGTVEVESATPEVHTGASNGALLADPSRTGGKSWIRRAGAVFLLLLAGAAAYVVLTRNHTRASRAVRSPSAFPARRLLAVLPFEPVVPKTTNQYLGVGLANALIVQLSQTHQPGFGVLPLESTLPFSHSASGLARIARKLQAQAILSGTIQRDGAKIRVSAELWDALSGASLWSGQFNARYSDIFDVEDTISRQVAAALLPALNEAAMAWPPRHGTTNIGAYDAYMQGLYSETDRSERGLEQAVQHFRVALLRDPDYAEAYAGLAESHTLLAFYGFIKPEAGYPLARREAEEALKIDPSLAQAHAVMMSIMTDYDWDWAGAEREFRLAVAADPDYATAYQWYAYVLLAEKRSNAAIQEMQRALALDPLSPSVGTSLAWAYYLARQYNASVAQLKQTLVLHPLYAPALQLMAIVLMQEGNISQAEKDISRVSQLAPANPATPLLLARLEALSSHPAAARKTLAKAAPRVENSALGYFAGGAWAAVGDKKAALTMLDHAYKSRSNWMLFAASDPQFDSLHGDRGFRSLLAKMNLSSSSPPSAGTLPGEVAYSVVKQSAVPRRSIAVLGFQNLSGRPADNWLSDALADMLSTEITAGRQFRAISGESVAHARRELRIVPYDGLSPATLSEVHRNLGADLVVTGAYALVGPSRQEDDQIRLDVRVQEGATGRTVATDTLSGKLSDLFPLVSRAGSKLRRDLNVERVSAASRLEARAASPSNLRAARLYAEGLAKLRDFDPLGARRLLEQAAETDPKFALAFEALARADSTLGYQVREEAEARRAYQLSPPLSREQRLWIRAQYLESESRWVEAEEVYRALFTFYPDRIRYAVRLARMQIALGKRSEALDTLRRLRELPAPLSTDPRIDLCEAAAWQDMSDFQRSLTPLRRAAMNAHARGEEWLYARALMMEAGARASLNNEDPRSLALDREAEQICRQLSDQSCVASVYRRLGYRELDSDPRGAELALDHALQIARRIGNQIESGNDQNGLAAIYMNEGRYAEADRIYRSFLAKARRTHDAFGLQMYLNNLGEAELEEGSVDEAKRTEEEAVAVSKRIGQKIGVADALFDLAEIDGLEGDLAGAAKNYNQAAAEFRGIGEGNGAQDKVMTGLAGVSRARGDYRTAESQCREALARLDKGQSDGQIADSQLALARVYLDEGWAQDALRPANQAAAAFQRLGRVADEGRARSVLAQVLWADRQTQAAVVEATRARQLEAGTQGRLPQVIVAVEAGRVLVAADQQANSPELGAELRGLRISGALAQSMHLIPLSLEAKLTIATVERRRGSPDTSSVLATIENRARSLGFLGLERRIQAARATHRLASRQSALKLASKPPAPEPKM